MILLLPMFVHQTLFLHMDWQKPALNMKHKALEYTVAKTSFELQRHTSTACNLWQNEITLSMTWLVTSSIPCMKAPENRHKRWLIRVKHTSNVFGLWEPACSSFWIFWVHRCTTAALVWPNTYTVGTHLPPDRRNVCTSTLCNYPSKYEDNAHNIVPPSKIWTKLLKAQHWFDC